MSHLLQKMWRSEVGNVRYKEHVPLVTVDGEEERGRECKV